MEGIARASGVLSLSTHTLRHLCLTDLARAGWDIHEIAAFAGHRTLASTLLYIHLSGRELSAKLAAGMDQIDAGAYSNWERCSHDHSRSKSSNARILPRVCRAGSGRLISPDTIETLFSIHASWPLWIDADVFPIGSVTGRRCFLTNSTGWPGP